jgi:hypothetical protein
MKKLILSAIVAPFILAGCSESDITNVEATIEADVAAACGFVPLASSIIEVTGDILSVAVPDASLLSTLSGSALAAVENDLCSASAAPASMLDGLLIPASLVTSSNGKPAQYIGKSRRGHKVYGWRVKK